MIRFAMLTKIDCNAINHSPDWASTNMLLANSTLLNESMLYRGSKYGLRNAVLRQDEPEFHSSNCMALATVQAMMQTMHPLLSWNNRMQLHGPSLQKVSTILCLDVPSYVDCTIWRMNIRKNPRNSRSHTLILVWNEQPFVRWPRLQHDFHFLLYIMYQRFRYHVDSTISPTIVHIFITISPTSYSYLSSSFSLSTFWILSYSSLVISLTDLFPDETLLSDRRFFPLLLLLNSVSVLSFLFSCSSAPSNFFRRLQASFCPIYYHNSTNIHHQKSHHPHLCHFVWFYSVVYCEHSALLLYCRLHSCHSYSPTLRIRWIRG